MNEFTSNPALVAPKEADSVKDADSDETPRKLKLVAALVPACHGIEIDVEVFNGTVPENGAAELF
ncbi:hypothetical protein R5W23_003012 [Gemmata sp. JC673]|uniref:Uncharacterized protein n=1 Tax=Gemmata algarum TaxID=2975278 RepID=A0ABU5ETE7_9BACT|nr:hypothetical protein [Gemmata algarum]MDY3557747.1 hypothetical protein [Gemmata algarum]